MEQILIIDDEIAIGESLKFALEDLYKVFIAFDSKKALQILDEQNIALILLDLKLGEENGLDLLAKVKKKNKNIVVIMMTAYSSIESTIDAIKMGAYYYITKPIKVNELKILINKGIEFFALNQKMERLEREIDDRYGANGIIGTSQNMNQVFSLIRKVKDIDSNILILGESGTGKELVAKAIHYQGKRKDGPFYVVNCAAIPKDLLESELFGYEKGAFTGAYRSKQGFFELANKGTLFLDEIGDMDIKLQAKLLRVLQERVVTPLGGSNPTNVDVRIIAATNVDLMEKVTNNEFRADLYYRLNVISIELPPLSKRKDDLPLLIKFFIDKKSKELNKKIRKVSNEALEYLLEYNYLGNVRELENIIERAVALAEYEIISVQELPEYIVMNRYKRIEEPIAQIMYGESLKDIEKKVILRTLQYTKNQKEAATILQISERALRNKLKQYRDEGLPIDEEGSI